MLNEIIKFSNKYKPQFTIDIDICVKKYDFTLLLFIENIFKKYNSIDYIKIFFIYDFKNKEIFLYKDFIQKNKYNNIYTVNFLKKYLYKTNNYE
jgi:hypothetical protein